jgi:hypothetical protein
LERAGGRKDHVRSNLASIMAGAGGTKDQVCLLGREEGVDAAPGPDKKPLPPPGSRAQRSGFFESRLETADLIRQEANELFRSGQVGDAEGRYEDALFQLDFDEMDLQFNFQERVS